MPVNSKYETVFVHRTQGGQNQMNVMRWIMESFTGTEPALDEIADEFSSQWATLILPMLPSTANYVGCKFRKLTLPTTNQILSNNGAGPGTMTGHPLPTSNSLIVSARAITATPRRRGRVYLPSPTEDENDANGKPTIAYRAAIETAFETWLTDPVTVVGAAGNAEMRYGFGGNGVGEGIQRCDYIIVRTEWGSQDRRRNNSRPDMPLF